MSWISFFNRFILTYRKLSLSGGNLLKLILTYLKTSLLGGNLLKLILTYRKASILGGISLIILLGGLIKGLFFSSNFSPRTLKAITVEVESVRVASIARTITAVGTLRANQSVTIKPLVNGQVAKINVEGGQEVKAGEAIVSIDDRKYRNKLKEAEAKLAFAELEFNRYDKLATQNLGKKKLYERAIADKKEAEALVDSAKKEIEDSVITAPFEGVITLNDISVGAAVNENTELFTIVDLDPIKIDFRIPAQYLKTISRGQSIKVMIDGFLDEKFEAYIEAIDARVDPNSHTIAVRANINNKNNLLKPGLFARIDIQVGSKDNALVVPAGAVQVNGDEESVYKLTYYDKEKAFIAIRHPIVTGLQEADKVEVLRGLDEGDLIVTVGQLKIRDGTPVSFEEEKKYIDKLKEEAQKKRPSAKK
jgi:membrane fusion protein (multidrug efflux system)